MNITLSIDPGAERLGWATFADKTYMTSGYHTVSRGKMKYQEYRLYLIDYWNYESENLFSCVDQMVNEIVPAAGSFNGSQMYLVNVAMTTIQTKATIQNIPISQIGATSWQAKIAIGRKTKKTSKVQCRNGVIKLFPELEDRKKSWTKIFEEPDAIGIGAAYLGLSNSAAT